MTQDHDTRVLTIHQPRTLVVGNGCTAQLPQDLALIGCRQFLIITSPDTARLAAPLVQWIAKAGCEARLWDGVDREPTIRMFEQALESARTAGIEGIIGLGGGSALDVAKLVAALLPGEQEVRDVFGIGKLAGRSVYLACIPTTAGTGSEVSPNAILLDESEELKKGVVSPWLVPDAAFVDPTLTVTVPQAITAATGMDALTHCIEAYTNRHAHPVIDLYALEGIRLIARSLERACANGEDIGARADLSLGSLYGGLCLGPVNTAAVHALAYPLGGRYRVAHGLANAILLPYMMDFNVTAATDRYADVATALGAEPGPCASDTALNGIAVVRDLAERCGTAIRLRDVGVPEDSIPHMAEAAMKVTRLLENNPRPMTHIEAEDVYKRAY